MLRKFGSHLRDQWMGALALFLVLSGGTAYAANTVLTGDIKDNEVFSTDVRNDTLPWGGLTSIDLRPGSVGSSEIATNGVDAPEIAENSISSAELQSDSVAFQELQFGTLPNFVYTTQDSTPVNTDTAKEITVDCDVSGGDREDKVTGGGFVINGPVGQSVPNVAVQRSYAVDADTWLVRANLASGTAPNWQLTVIANCVA